MKEKDIPNQKESFWQKNHEKILFAVLLFGVPLVINYFLTYGLPNVPILKDLFLTGENLNNETWLGFWGSYLGALIGVVPAYLALNESRRQAEVQHDENGENRRLSVLPVFSCNSNELSFAVGQEESYVTLHSLVFLRHDIGFYDQFSTINPEEYEKKMPQNNNYGYIFFELFNIGVGPALNVFLTCTNILLSKPIRIKSIGSHEKCTLILAVYIPHDTDDSYSFQYNIGITFSDVFGNQYQQVQPITVTKEQFFLSNITYPKLIIN